MKIKGGGASIVLKLGSHLHKLNMFSLRPQNRLLVKILPDLFVHLVHSSSKICTVIMGTKNGLSTSIVDTYNLVRDFKGVFELLGF